MSDAADPGSSSRKAPWPGPRTEQAGGIEPAPAAAGVALPPLTVTVAAAASAAAGLVHATAAGTHAGDRQLVILFAVTAVAQLAWGAIAMVRPVRPVLLAGVVLNGAAALAWVLSRSFGLPVIDSLSQPEEVGVQDLIAAALGALATFAALLAVVNPVRRRAHALPALIAAIVVFALAVPAMAVEHGDGASHDHGDAEDTTGGGGRGRGGAGDGELTREERREQRREERQARREAEQEGENGGGEDGEDGHSHDGSTTVPGSDESGSGPITSLDDPRVTADQRAAAQTLIDSTATAMTAYADTAAVEAAGYHSIGDGRTGFEHFVSFEFLADGVELDPARVESIVFAVDDDGDKQLVSAMYILDAGKTMADVPDIAGDITTWHDHQDLCWDDNGRVVGVFRNGACRPSGTLIPTPPMLHVWVVPNDCGPFAGIDGHGEACA
jgi:hypothetical protein